ncbi:MAG TPA: arylesterase [Hyphomonadaceae bacterium]|nr:arylesterase [Hyphomonadaceae bacterium]HPN06964.1 arylesterase [Hyphomonadaceae bacterium]
MREAAAPVANPPVASDGSVMANEKIPTVVMLGDSLTAGYELSESEALPAVVERMLADKGVKAKVVNAGVSGDTTADGLNRYDWSVKGTGADLLVVALGANDFLMKLAPERPKKNLAAILDRAKADGIPAVLIGVAIPDNNLDPQDQAYAAIYPDLAAQYGVPYLKNFMAPVAGRSDLLMEDGLHPTARGVEAMAFAVTEFLAPVVAKLD